MIVSSGLGRRSFGLFDSLAVMVSRERFGWLRFGFVAGSCSAWFFWGSRGEKT